MNNEPNDLTAQKRFRRIVDMMIDAVDDEITDLAEALVIETGGEAMPDIENNEEYDRWCEEVLQPMQNLIYRLIGEYMQVD